jgi:hypothetical protein
MGKTLILKPLLRSPNSISFILIIFTFKLIQTIRILWFCHRSKTTVRAQFYEGMSALDRPTPNSRQLMAVLGHPLPPEETDTPVPVDCGLVAATSPFQTLITITVPIRCDSPNLGLQLATCAARSRAFIQGIAPGSTCVKLRY